MKAAVHVAVVKVTGGDCKQEGVRPRRNEV